MSRISPSSKPRSEASESLPDYRPNINRYARNLITRIQKNQGDVEAIELLAQHYTETGDQPSLVNLMEGWGDALQEPRAAADAYVRAAEGALIGLQDRERARTLYERALSRDAAHLEALESVLQLLTDDGNFERQKQVLKFVAFQLGMVECDPMHHASVYFRLGQVYETRFDEPGKAAASYRSAIERNPSLVPAIVAARRLYEAVGNGRAVAALYDFEIEATGDEHAKRALLVALAEVKRRELGDLDGAIGTLRRVLQSAKGDIEALRMLGEVLVERSERADQADGSVDRKRAAEVFYQLGRTLPDADGHAYLQRALQLCPEHEKATKLLYERGTRGLRDDKTQLLALEDLQAAEMLPTDGEPGHVPDAVTVTVTGGELATQSLVRDSAEVWLNESEPVKSALSTGELLPLELSSDAIDERPSSLPPRELAQGASTSLAMPTHAALRAPRVPSTPTTSRGEVYESTEVPAPRRTVPPPPPTAALRPSAAPPAYAEIPGESGEHFTPVRGHHAFGRSSREDTPASAARRDPTLRAWRLPSDVRDASIDAAPTHDVSDALTPIVNELPAVAPEYELPVQHDGAVARLSSLPIASTQTARAVEPEAQPSNAPERRPASRRSSVQNERFSDLARAALGTKAASAELPGASTAEDTAAARPQPSAANGSNPSTRVTAGEPAGDAAHVPLDVEVGALSDSNFYVGFDNRIASGGVFVATYTPLGEGSPVDLRIALPGGFSGRALGRVWRARSHVEPFSDQLPGMWVQLEALSEGSLRLFERFASHRPPLFWEA